LDFGAKGLESVYQEVGHLSNLLRLRLRESETRRLLSLSLTASRRCGPLLPESVESFQTDDQEGHGIGASRRGNLGQ